MKSPHLDPTWLRAKYIDEGLSTYDIGRLVGRDPKRIYEKLCDFNIPTRPRGENLKGVDCYMKRKGVINPFFGKKHSEQTRCILSKKASVEKPHLRGSGNGMSGRTGKANPNYKDGSSPERQRLYSSAEWKETISAVFLRDAYRCVRCGAGKSGKSGIHAHHILPWAKSPEGRFNRDNLVTLCRPCHHWVHSRENINHDYLK